MNQENVNKLVVWLGENKDKYSAEQLKQTALAGGPSEEEFNEALRIINTKVESLEYIGVGRRFFATVLDCILLFIFAIYFTYQSFSNGMTLLNSLFSFVFPLISFMYLVIMEWKLGATLGKMIVGIRVVKSTGGQISLSESLIRNIMRIVDFLPFFYLVAAISVWNSKCKQRIGDIVAKTVVVSKSSIN